MRTTANAVDFVAVCLSLLFSVGFLGGCKSPEYPPVAAGDRLGVDQWESSYHRQAS